MAPWICPAAVGVKVTVTVSDAPAATVPLVGLAVKTECPVLMPLTVSVLFPVLLMLNVTDRLAPTNTAPPLSSARISPQPGSPEIPMMRVSVTGAAVPVPETVVVLVPLVASLVTVSVLL